MNLKLDIRELGEFNGATCLERINENCIFIGSIEDNC